MPGTSLFTDVLFLCFCLDLHWEHFSCGQPL